MHKHTPILLFIVAMLLAFMQPREHLVYLPFVYQQPVPEAEVSCYGHIQSDVYEDLDGDGQRDDGEAGLPDVRLILRSYDESGVRIAATDLNGRHWMKVPSGQYALHAIKPSGYRWTTPQVWGIDIMCATVRVTFGLKPLVGDANVDHSP